MYVCMMCMYMYVCVYVYVYVCGRVNISCSYKSLYPISVTRLF